MDVSSYIEQVTGIGVEWQYRIALSIVVIAFFSFLNWLVKKGIMKVEGDAASKYSVRKVSSNVLFFLASVILFFVWFRNLDSFATVLGLFSAGLAISLKDPLANIAGWYFILWRKPFKVGDRLQVAQFAGDVVDIRLFQFSLLEIGNWVDADQTTGRIIHVPNALVFTNPQINYSEGFNYIWNEIALRVTFESNWKKAKQLMQEILEKHATAWSANAEKEIQHANEKYMIIYRKLTPTVYTSLRENGVLLTMRYLCPPRQRRGTEQVLIEAILEAFAQHSDIAFAYPTQRFVHQSPQIP
ncbi:MAG: mechanosensitive ion channel family protein [Flammeovirgaceae bacterium]|nr:mechanosensitive ion channel family protein [Flammeovirgaceae bacterium]MDW8288738.1 mechanosensitive ion channel [Flammeovirgaceae bacterium]